MKVFVVGGSGLVGNNCLKHFSKQEGVEVKGSFFSYETEETEYYDTLNPENPDNFNIEEYHPDLIIHCGALTHVDYCEENPDESHLKTVISTQNVVKLCKKIQSRLIFISSDYVFDGKEGPYDESHPVNPLSVYGKHKLQAENYVRDNISGSSIIRITNVYGEEERNKNFIARLIENRNQKDGLHLKTVYDQFATPVNAYDVAKAAFLLGRDKKEGIYHIAGTDYMNRHQLASRVLKYFPDNNVTLTPISTEELGQKAPRPLQGGMKSRKFLEEYPGFEFSNVDDYLKMKQNQ